MRSTQTASLVTATLIALLLSGLGQAQEETDSGISAQPLTKALAEFAEQTGMQLVYPSELTAGVDSNGASTEGTPDEILDELLASTGLEYEYVNDRTIAIAASVVIGVDDQRGDSDSKNVSAAPILMAQNQTRPVRMTVSNRNDNGSNRDDADNNVGTMPLEEIIVVGTNIRGVENPTVPVLTFDREDIALSGAATVDDFLRTIPQNFASETQLTAESGNPFTSGRNRSQGTSVDLRGLGGGSTLVLLNGRRLPFSGDAAIIDVNVIPIGAIERVEILTDGATAVYGSDAVGGVINFITRDSYSGFDVNARYGTVTDGSREDWAVGGSGGFSWGSGSIFAGVDYQEEKPLLVEERDFISLINGREGATLGSNADRLGVSGNVKQEIGSKLRGGVNTFYSNTVSDSFSVTNTVPEINLSEQTSLSINPSIEYDINDRIIASFFADITRNRTDASATETLSGTVRRSDFDNDLTVYEGRISGQVLDLPGGAVSFSLGGLHRSEEFVASADGVPSTTGKREIKVGYGELLVPIFGEANPLPFVQKMDVSLAGRYEDYDDFGDSFDPKIGLYWEVNDRLSFRASYSEAFRAPDLLSINNFGFANITGFPASFFTGQRPDEEPIIDDFFGFGPAYVALTQSGGNSDLRPERANTWSAGFSYKPIHFTGFVLEGNFFDISYTDRLERVTTLSSIQNPAFFPLADIDPDLATVQSFFDRGAAGEINFFNGLGFLPDEVQVVFAPTFTNVSERDVRGIDLTFNYTAETDLGEFSAGANATYLIDYTGRVSSIAPSREEINTLYRPVDFKMRGELSWSRGGLMAFTAINYVDGYRDDIDESIANDIDAWTTIDLSLAYETGERFDSVFVNNVRLGLNFTNLLDNDPPFVVTPFGLNFDSANANPWGRQVHFTISKSF